MSELVRWKEYRVRQEIYIQHLQTETSAARDSNDANAEAGSRVSVSFVHQILGEPPIRFWTAG